MTSASDPDNPVAPFSRLMARLAKECQEEGLHLFGFTVVPNYNPDGPHTAQGLFDLVPDWGKAEEKVEDPEFDAFVKAQEQHEAQERVEQAREGLQGLADDLKNPRGGLGLDD
jgi:hypothetical protein